MKLLYRSLTHASVSALATVWAVGTASAQATGQGDTTGQGDRSKADALQEVVVTGIRRSLETAEAIKQNADQLVDSVTAEDIGRFPDSDIAESLQRISGIQIQRNLGEGSTVAIRGLSDVRTELNGHDIFTANGGVGLSFEEIAPDLLSRVDVYKNPAAEMIEGALGGTIDLRTRMPFDASGRLLSATGSVTRYDLAKKYGRDLSGLYSDRWNTDLGEIGLLLNASEQTSAFREDKDQVEPYLWHGPSPDPNGAPVQNTLVPGYETQNIQVPQGGGFQVSAGDRKRRSYTAVLQWRPNDRLEAYAQVLAATYHFQDTGVSFFATDNSAAPTGTFTVDNGVATSGALYDPSATSITFGGQRDTQTIDYTTGLNWRLTDKAHVVVDYQHINAWVHQDTVNLYIAPYTARTGVPGEFNADYNYLFDNRGQFPTQSSSNPDFFSNPANYGFSAIQPDRTRNDAKADALRADLLWEFDDGSFLKGVSSGARLSKKSAINRDTNVNNWTSIGSCANWSTAANCYKVSDFPQFVEYNPGQATLLRGAAANSVFGPVLQWNLSDALNPATAFADVKAISGQVIGFGDLNNPAQSTTSTVDETDSALYVRASFGSKLMNRDWDGNVGARYVRTEETGHGFEVLSYRTAGGTNPTSTSATVPYDGGRKYQRVLPSLNLRLHITRTLQARFAFSQNIFRPTFTQLNPSYTLSPSYNGSEATPTPVNPSQPYNAVTNPYQGTGTVAGNPDLKPERVTSFDGALEWYFAHDGLAYITLFDKKLKDIIDSRTFATTRNIPNVGEVLFNVNAFTNVTSGYVRGFEIGAQKFFDFLPGPLAGLGTAANFTRADSNAGTAAVGTIGSQTQLAVPLINLSRNSYNLMALYDYHGWNARLAYNWRDKYLDSVSETGAATLPIYFKAYGVIDASVSYDFDHHVALTLDGQNLTDAVTYSYQGEPRYLRNYQIDDRRVSLRVRWRN
ncbi:MAG: TonB-dependent receptor [Gammaproteobacteria bacterium]|nr:TonB-dependent receptor [Gammaproteobacteria bacterium]